MRRGCSRGIGVGGLLAVFLGWVVWTAPAVAGSRPPIRPVLGDWEGTGPLGLRLSFAFVRVGGRVVVAHFALGLPTGCRATGMETWAAGTQPQPEYIEPGTVLHGPFPPLGPTQFEFIPASTRQQPLPAPYEGSFSSSRRGRLSIESPTRFGCPQTGWPRTLTFSLAARHRVPVADGLWTGSVGSPAGMSGTVSIRVIDHGRIETDFSATYACPGGGGSGSLELGPLPTVGYLIAANGSIGETKGTEMVWKGRFAANGTISGTFNPPACSQPIEANFTAQRSGS